MWKISKLSSNIYGDLLRARKLSWCTHVHSQGIDWLSNSIFNAQSRGKKIIPRALVSECWCCLKYKLCILRKASFLVWRQLSKEKAKSKLEETKSPGVCEMQNIEAHDLKMFCDMAESSHINKATNTNPKPAFVWAHQNHQFSVWKLQNFKTNQQNKTRTTKAATKHLIFSVSCCSLCYFHVSNRSQWLSVGFWVEI